MANTPTTQPASAGAANTVISKLPEQVKSFFKTTTITISKTGSKHWTGDKSLTLATEMIKNASPDENPAFTPEFKDIIELVFDPTSEVKMRVLKRAAAADGIVIDPATEGVLDLMMDQGQFTTALSKTKDPATDMALIVKKTKKNRTDKLKNLLGTE